MKTTVIYLALVLAGSAFGQVPIATPAEAVAQRDHDLNELIKRHDMAAAKDFYDDRFVLTTSSGKMKGKGTLLAEIAAEGLRLDANETSGIVVRVRDNTALLTGILHQSGVYNGKTFDVHLRVTDTWVLVGGSWRLLGGHASVI